MKEKQYLYKVQKKLQKHPEMLLSCGFSKYEDELGEETLYAMPITLTENGSIFAYLKKALEKIYTHATSEEKATDFKDYNFNKIVNVDNDKSKDSYDLEITDDIRNEFTKAQLCLYDNGTGKWCLFINAPDNVQYYNAKTLEEECKDIIAILIEKGVIYKAKNRRNV